MKYLFYDANGNVNLIYYQKPPKSVFDNYYGCVKYDGDIPEKKGHSTKIKINVEERNVEFYFVEIPKSIDDEVYLLKERLKEAETTLINLLME